MLNCLRDTGVAQVVEHLTGKYKALSTNPITAKIKKKKKLPELIS
jgi:hypothetical protein